MHHNPAKNVLHLEFRSRIAKATRSTRKTLQGCCVCEQENVCRAAAEADPITSTSTIYTGWNALAITAYFDAAQVLSLREPKDFALRTLDRILAAGWSPATGLAHVISYPDAHQRLNSGSAG